MRAAPHAAAHMDSDGVLAVAVDPDSFAKKLELYAGPGASAEIRCNDHGAIVLTLAGS